MVLDLEWLQTLAGKFYTAEELKEELSFPLVMNNFLVNKSSILNNTTP
jgi:hypothetical protein